MKIDNTGNVGIGTDSPDALLHVEGVTRTKYLRFQNLTDATSEVAGMYSSSGGGTNDLTIYASALSSTSSNIEFLTAPTNSAATITLFLEGSSGNVGIGTNNPAIELDVYGDGSGVAVGRPWGNDAYVSSGYFGKLANTAAGGGWAAGSAFMKIEDSLTEGVRKGTNIDFVTHNYGNGNQTTMTLSAEGNVGLGDTSPAHKLEVNDSNNYQGVHIRGSNAPCFTMAQGTSATPQWRMGISGYDGADFAISTGAGTNDKFRMDPDGNSWMGNVNNITPRINLHSTGDSASFNGPISSGYAVGPGGAQRAPITRDWFTYSGGTSIGTNRYVHMKTNLLGGGTGVGNQEFTMSLFHYHGFYYYGANYYGDGTIGWHNWSGTFYNVQKNNYGNFNLVQDSYMSSDGYVVLVADVIGGYAQFTIDWHQWGGYSFRDKGVTNVTNTSSTSGAY
jgi:hypothetical protein